MAPLALKIQHGVDHMFNHPRPGDLAIFGDMANQNNRHAIALGKGGQLVRRGANLTDSYPARSRRYRPTWSGSNR